MNVRSVQRNSLRGTGAFKLPPTIAPSIFLVGDRKQSIYGFRDADTALFDEAALAYPWTHPDPRVDQLCEAILAIVKDGQDQEQSRSEIFERVWQVASESAGEARTLPVYSRNPVPRLSENWFC